MGIFKAKFCKSILLSSVLLGVPILSQADDISSVQWFEREIGDGVVWKYYLFQDLYGSPQSVSYIEADLNNPNVEVALPHLLSSRARTSVMVPAQEPSAVGAVNGTFFDTSVGGGGHVTYLRINGVNQQAPGAGGGSGANGAITIDASDNVAVSRRSGATWDNDVTSTDILANGPFLLDSGTIQDFTTSGTFCTSRHPRTTVGITASNKLILMTVDGRTSSSAGMTCDELAQTMLELGCANSTNLDGGGSTTLWVDGELNNGVVNYPSDNTLFDHSGERSCSNAIAIISTPAAAVQWDGRIHSITAPTLTRTGETYTVTATVENLGTETWTSANVDIITSRAFSRTSDFIPSGQESTFYSMSPASVTTGQLATFTLTLESPVVATDTNYIEYFALSNTSTGNFGPADNDLYFSATVRPELVGAPPTMIVQGTATGINNQWYDEPTSGWGNSSLSFGVAGVTDGGFQRYASASSTRSARFRPIFDADGVYSVEVAFPSSSNNIAVQYSVTDSLGTRTFNLDQHPSGGQNNQWVLLANDFEFTTGASGGFGLHDVTISNPSTTGNRFYSGAVRFDYQGPLSAEIESWNLY